jgi:hypothetical protein
MGCLFWDLDDPSDIPPIVTNGYGTRTYRKIVELGIDKRIDSSTDSNAE